MTTISQLSSRLVDIFGPVASATPTAILGNLMVSPAGNVLIGSTTDDTSNKLQVTGQFKATSTATIGTGLANYVSLAGAATTNYPTITTAGTDASPSLYLSAKGSGQVVIGATGGLSVSTTAYVAGATTLNSTLTVNGAVTLSSGGCLGTGLNGLGQFVAISGPTGYGAGMRNDGTNFYLLQTASGSPTGGYNAYRPFSWALASGAVQIDGTGIGTLIGTSTRYNADTVNIAGVLCTYGGYRCRTGGGGTVGNAFNFNWTSSTVQVWIDTTNVGNMTLSSDIRIKHSVETNQDDLLQKVLGLRVVNYRIKDVDIFTDDGKTRLGYIAGEVQSIFPQAVHGEPDALTEDGGIQPQTLDPIPLIAAHTGAMQRLNDKFEAMANRISELEAQLNKMKV